MPWIDHPACQDGPVSWARYLKWRLSEWLYGWSRRLEWEALHPDRKDDIPF